MACSTDLKNLHDLYQSEGVLKELLNEDVFVICVFDADVSRRSDAENKMMAALKKNMGRMVMLFCATVCNQLNIGSFCTLRILAVISKIPQLQKEF